MLLALDENLTDGRFVLGIDVDRDRAGTCSRIESDDSINRGVCKPLVPEALLQIDHRGVEAEQIQRSSHPENNAALHLPIAQHRLGLHDVECRDEGWWPLDDVERHRNLVLTLVGNDGVYLGFTKPALPVEDLDSDHVAFQLRVIEVFPVVEVVRLADEADGPEDNRHAVRFVGRNALHQLLELYGMHAVQLEVNDLRIYGRSFGVGWLRPKDGRDSQQDCRYPKQPPKP